MNRAFGVGLMLAIASLGNSAQAQSLVLDGTVGPATELQGPVYKIPQALGTTAEQNLFHSFSQFGLRWGESANFQAAPEIRNIFTRVTGGVASEIDGLISVTGSDANLFLLNPAGILFGPNAQLEIGGSFLGTTAGAIAFGNQGEFSAVQPEAANLLTVSPSALRFSAQQGSIVSGSVAPAGTNTFRGELFGLRVAEGRSLSLLGGDVTIDGGNDTDPNRILAGGLNAPGGRIDLGGLAEAGEVALEVVGNGIVAEFPAEASLADVSLVNNARVDVRGNGGGDIAVYAEQFRATEGGRLNAGTEGSGNAGDIVVRAKDVLLSGSAGGNEYSSLYNNALDGTGNGGDIVVLGDRLQLTQGATLRSDTFSQGNSGNTTLKLTDSITLSDLSSISSDVNTEATGNSGNIEIQTGQFQALSGSKISTGVYGQGNSGALTIEADDILFSGIVSCGDRCTTNTGIFSPVLSGGQRTIGDITITANTLRLIDGGSIDSFVGGIGQASKIKLEIRDLIQLDSLSSFIDSSFQGGGEGRSGSIEIRTSQLSLNDQASISTSTNGRGDAGNIRIDAKEIRLQKRSSIRSDVFASRESDFLGEGNGGDIQINTGSLMLLDGSQISSFSSGKGNAGNIEILARDEVQLQSSHLATFVDSFKGSEAIRKAGDIVIQARSLTLLDSALNSSSLAQGDAGSIVIRTQDFIRVDGPNSFVGTGMLSFDENYKAGDIEIETGVLDVGEGIFFSTITRGGKGGDIRVLARDRISLAPEARFLTTTNGPGRAGDIEIKTPNMTLAKDAALAANTFSSGDAGDIRVQVNNHLSLQYGAQFVTITEGSGNAGKIVIQTNNLEIQGISSSSRPSGLFSNAQRGAQGRAGDIEIQAKSTTITNQGVISASSLTSANQPASDVRIVGDRLILDQGSIFTASDSGNGGNLTLNLADTVLLRNGSLLETTAGRAGAGGNGGNIAITTPILIGLPDNNSDIIANAFSGSGGNISISADAILNFELASGQSSNQLRANRTNDISASSQLGTSGSLTISGLNTDPSQGTVQLPATPTDPSNQLDHSCSAEALATNRFVITGRSGIPASPSEGSALAQPFQPTWIPLPTEQSSLSHPQQPTQPVSQSSRPTVSLLLEANRWQKNAQGIVMLTADRPVAIPTGNCLAKT